MRKKLVTLIFAVLLVLAMPACSESKERTYDEEGGIAITLNGSTGACEDEGVEISGSTVTISHEGTYVISGKLDDGQIIVEAEKTDNIQLVLDGAVINCNTSAPLYVKQANSVTVYIKEDTETTLSNKSEFVAIDENNIDSVIFSKSDLSLEGEGTLTIDAVYGHGIVSKDALLIVSGDYNITSEKHGISGKDSVTAAGGRITVESEKDGIHSDGAVAIKDGSINIVDSNEGIEGKTIEISGGTTVINSIDDGLNAADSNTVSGQTATTEGIVEARPEGTTVEGMTARPERTTEGGMGRGQEEANPDCYVKITGGKLIINSGADGIDSNGNLYISGGETYISGPTSGGDGALDYAGEGQITGGIVVAAGSSGMAQNFGTTSSQGAIQVNFSENIASGSAIVLKDSSGKVLAEYTPEKQYNSVVVSCPEIEIGKTYTVTAGTRSKSVEMTSLIYGSGGMGRPQGGGRPMTNGEKTLEGERPQQ